MRAVRIDLGGKERELKYDFNALADFEDLMGMGVSAAFQGGQVGIRTIRALFWAGLRHKEKGLTLERVGKMLTKELEKGTSMEDLMGYIEKAMEASGMKPKPEDEEDDFDEDEEEVKN